MQQLPPIFFQGWAASCNSPYWWSIDVYHPSQTMSSQTGTPKTASKKIHNCNVFKLSSLNRLKKHPWLPKQTQNKPADSCSFNPCFFQSHNFGLKTLPVEDFQNHQIEELFFRRNPNFLGKSDFGSKKTWIPSGLTTFKKVVIRRLLRCVDAHLRYLR